MKNKDLWIYGGIAVVIVGGYFLLKTDATKYNCNEGVCEGPFITGTYNSSADCMTACMSRYACKDIGGMKYCTFDDKGPYTDVIKCQNECK